MKVLLKDAVRDATNDFALHEQAREEEVGIYYVNVCVCVYVCVYVRQKGTERETQRCHMRCYQ